MARRRKGRTIPLISDVSLTLWMESAQGQRSHHGSSYGSYPEAKQRGLILMKMNGLQMPVDDWFLEFVKFKIESAAFYRGNVRQFSSH